MPTYDLTCQDCGERFDRFLMRILREGDKVCPRCGSHRVRQGVGGGYLGSGIAASDGRAHCGRGAFT